MDAISAANVSVSNLLRVSGKAQLGSLAMESLSIASLTVTGPLRVQGRTQLTDLATASSASCEKGVVVQGTRSCGCLAGTASSCSVHCQGRSATGCLTLCCFAVGCSSAGCGNLASASRRLRL